jgi:hypothetical protein
MNLNSQFIRRMAKLRRMRRLALQAAILGVLSACGGGYDSDEQPEVPPPAAIATPGSAKA